MANAGSNIGQSDLDLDSSILGLCQEIRLEGIRGCQLGARWLDRCQPGRKRESFFLVDDLVAALQDWLKGSRFRLGESRCQRGQKAN